MKEGDIKVLINNNERTSYHYEIIEHSIGRVYMVVKNNNIKTCSGCCFPMYEVFCPHFYNETKLCMVAEKYKHYIEITDLL